MKKKLLIHEVFEKAKKESGKDSKNGRAEYLSLLFEDKLNFQMSEKSFVRYYDNFIRDEKEDRNIDTPTLNKMSEYLGFQNFNHFCNTETFTKINEDSSFTSVKISVNNEDKSITEKLSQIVVNITTTPIFKLPEFFTKQSNLGIIGVIILGGVLGNKLYNIDENSNKVTVQDSIQSTNQPVKSDVKTIVYIPQTPASQVSQVDTSALEEKDKTVSQKQCMYWNGKEYIAENCSEPQQNLIALDLKKVAHFKKITTPDTITEKSLNKVYYSKYKHEIEFFTMEGKNPENGKSLKPITEYIINKYTK